MDRLSAHVKQSMLEYPSIFPTRLSVLSVAFYTFFSRGGRYYNIENALYGLGFGGFFSAGGWAFLSQRAERGKQIVLTETRESVAKGLFDALCDWVQAMTGPERQDYTLRSARVLDQIIKQNGYWPTHMSLYAQGTFATQKHFFKVLTEKGIDVPPIYIMLSEAVEDLSASEYSPEKAKIATRWFNDNTPMVANAA